MPPVAKLMTYFWVELSYIVVNKRLILGFFWTFEAASLRDAHDKSPFFTSLLVIFVVSSA